MRYDAIIVGARVAGSATGLLLARKGMKVLLVDKASFPSDTISTHYIHAAGIARLNRWGLLDRLRKTGCPPIRRIHFDFGPFGIAGTPPPAEGGIQEAYAPRRTVLDKLLADAAVEAGCDLRENCRVDELLSDGGRVMGVRAKGGPEFADIVIGADGPRSMVASCAGAPAYDTKPALACIYYAYWSGLDLPDAQLRIRPRHTTISFPTHDGLTLSLVSAAISEYPRLRRDHESAYTGMLPEEIRGGRRETRVVGTADLPNFYRQPYGTGWALAGDAGYDRDLLTAQGISDAFRDAELLADALCRADRMAALE
jgi:flavin-dependent dehydrogenase